MTTLIPAAGHVALIRHATANGKSRTERKPVLAWDEHGNAYVHDVEWGGMRRAGEIDGYKGTAADAPPVVTVLPAVGWTAEFIDEEGGRSTEPVIAWLVRADGGVGPVCAAEDGGGFDPSDHEIFSRLIGPGEKTNRRARPDRKTVSENPGLPRVVPCPACKEEAVYVRSLDRYVHYDGSDNRVCWLAFSRGEAS